MVEFRRITLRGEISPAGSIEFTTADVGLTATTLFAVVYYEDEGQAQPEGLRLDLTKKVFLDHFDDPVKERALSSSAVEVANTVATKWAELKTSLILPRGTTSS